MNLKWTGNNDTTECVMLTYFALFCSRVDSSWIFATCFPALLSAPLPCEEKKTGKNNFFHNHLIVYRQAIAVHSNSAQRESTLQV